MTPHIVLATNLDKYMEKYAQYSWGVNKML